MTAKIKPNELSIHRRYNAKIHQVWDAWVDPKQVDHWWGPRGFSLKTLRKDVKAGGDWHFTMLGPDGVEYPNYAKYLEVDPRKKLVYDHGSLEDQPPMFRVRVLFSGLNDQTHMHMIMTFPTVDKAQEARQFVKQSGGESTWDRLAEYLEMQKSGKDIFVINRSFDVDLTTMFKVWTTPDHIMNWTPPVGFTGKYLSEDIRPGGSTHYVMTGPGITMYGKATYMEVNRETGLVYTQCFVDEHGKISRHPMAATWPETMKTSVRFFEETPNQTRVTLEWEVFGNATEVERSTFSGAKAGMTQGWTGSFDKLEQYLKTI